ncbi:MAG: hypothetical protein RMI79_05735 [Nitrososphaerota archaeon]|nr:hypothetical protein [Nitrososphaerota archaeon]
MIHIATVMLFRFQLEDGTTDSQEHISTLALKIGDLEEKRLSA